MFFYFFCLFDYLDFEGFLFILRTFEISNGYFYFIHLINFFYFFIYNTDFSLQSSFILSLCFLYFASYFHHILLLFSYSPNISLVFFLFSILNFSSSSSTTILFSFILFIFQAYEIPSFFGLHFNPLILLGIGTYVDFSSTEFLLATKLINYWNLTTSNIIFWITLLIFYF